MGRLTFGVWDAHLETAEIPSQQTASHAIRTEKQVMNLHDFVQDENIRRYQQLLSTSKDDAERQTILKLLTEEIAKRNSQTGRKMQQLADQ